MSRRKIGWREMLIQHIETTKELPFRWGSQDCALWAAGAVDAQCGTSLLLQLYGNYSCAPSAASFMRSRGWSSLEDSVRSLLYVDPTCGDARCGDLVLMQNLKRGALGVMLDDSCYTMTTHGLRKVPRQDGWLVFHV